MNQEYSHAHHAETVRWICVFVAIILLFVGFAWCAIQILRLQELKDRSLTQVGSGQEQNANDEGTFDTLIVDETVADGETVFPMPQAMSFTTLLASETNTTHTATVRIQATVLPKDASNKAVDWTVEWGDGASLRGQNVGDYVEVVPTSDGSTVADVICKKPFGNDTILIKVTTRDSGKSATCTARYLGHPTVMTIDTSGITVGYDSKWDTTLGAVFTDNEYQFSIALDNEFGCVPDSFTPSFTLSMTAHGSIVTEKKVYDSTGTLTATTEGTYSPVVSKVDDSGKVRAQIQVLNQVFFPIKAVMEDGKLTVSLGASPSTYTASTANPSVRAEESFKAYLDEKPLYFTITVTETQTGISASINLAVYASVSEVQLTPTEIGF